MQMSLVNFVLHLFLYLFVHNLAYENVECICYGFLDTIQTLFVIMGE